MDADTELSSIFDVKGYAVTRKSVSFGLTFALGSVDVQALVLFAKRGGVLVVDKIGDIPADEQTGDEE